MVTTVRPICVYCKHFQAQGDASLTCTAFPSGIPAAILETKVAHTKRYPGDQGIMFEAIDKAAEKEASLLLLSV